MDVSTLPGLPLAVTASAALIAGCVTALLAVFAKPIARIPGFRPEDDTRNAYMRGLVGVLNLAGLAAVAWTQNAVIPRQDWPALLGLALGQTVLAHLGYKTGQAAASKFATDTAVRITPDGKAALAQVQSQARTTAQPFSATTDTRITTVTPPSGTVGPLVFTVPESPQSDL